MLDAVMDGMKAPEEGHAMLQSMTPIHQEITQQDDFGDLQPERLGSDHLPETQRNGLIQPEVEMIENDQHQSTPAKIVAEEETQVGRPFRTKNSLLFFRGKNFFQRPEERCEEEEAQAGAEQIVEKLHAGGRALIQISSIFAPEGNWRYF